MNRISKFSVSLVLCVIPLRAVPAQQGKVLTLPVQANGMPFKVAYPSNWSVSPQKFGNAVELLSLPAEQAARVPRSQLGRVLITYDKVSGHAEALRMLKEIADEEAGTTFLNIGGWPALQRRFVAPVARPNRGEMPEQAEELRITTAIAAGPVLVRMEARIPLGADPLVADDAQAIGQVVEFEKRGDPAETDQQLRWLESQPRKSPHAPPAGGPKSSAPSSATISTTSAVKPATPGSVALADVQPAAATSSGLAQLVYPGIGELEVAVSSDGRSIVIAGNGDVAVSGNGGQTFSTNVTGATQNDPSLAVGVSGAFYQAAIGSAPGSNTTRIARSTDGGSNFVFVANAASCSTNGPGCTLPDQEHIAADRFNIAPGGGDILYSTWRLCQPGCLGVLVTWSTNNGATWVAPITVDSGGDFPRITVGADGSVYIVYATGGQRDGIRVRKYSSAAAGFNLIAQADVLAAGSGSALPGSAAGLVSCPMPGLDRCNDGNLLSSPTIAVNDLNPNHVYVAYARTTGPGNEDVFVQDSVLGGTNWPAARTVRLNNPFPGRRYMPWLATVGGAARVSWYDRRASSASLDNSLTDFYSGSAFLDGAGNLVAGQEFKVSPVSDSNCQAGWPCAPRSTNDSEYCSLQPQFAGVCSNTTTRCDFSTPTNCAMGVACQTGGGCPKYGDYNGIAAAAGRVYNAWTSATNPQGALTGLSVYFAARVVCCVPQIQIPGSVNLPGTCVGATNVATLMICNTGKEDLEVGTITSSSTEFRVQPPSSGYPVVISPDFCFPFQVEFAPTSAGAKSATLFVPSNDSVNPTATVSAVGAALVPQIVTAIANGGRFGNVCLGQFKDLDVTINNSGGCDLRISNITSSDPEFKTATVMSFPVVIQAGTSTHIPIRLEPTSLGMKAGTITFNSNDPVTPVKNIPVSGNTPPGSLRLTGSTDFGDVCPGVLAEKQLAVCNVGTCNLNVSSVGFVGACPNFTLVNNPFPAAVSPDSCQNVTIRYTPTNCGSHTCTLRVITDDPNALTNDVTITGNTPCPTIDVPPDVCFPPTVIQSVGACSSLKPFPVSNTGKCNLTITSVTLGGANPAAYALVGLPSFPIILEPGHVIGEGNFKIAFQPLNLSRDTLATISVSYLSDPVAGVTTTVTRVLNGEGVRTGARVLVVDSAGVPLPLVEKLQIQRINANRNKNLLDTVETIQNLTPQTFVPAAPCAAFTYHREYSTVSNPIQLLPGSYQVTATAVVGGKRKSKTVGFDVQTCTFNPTVVITLP